MLLLGALLALFPASRGLAQFDGPIERPERTEPYRASNAIYSDQLAFQNPLFDSSYRGGERTVLARWGRGEIDEFDLFIFLAVAGHPHPNVVELYRKARTPAERLTLEEELRLAIRAYAMTHRLARETDAVLSPIERKTAEVLALQGWSLAWTERVLEPAVSPTRADAYHEYQANPYEYYRPEEATVRVILRRFEAPEPPTEEELGALETEARFARIGEYQLAIVDEQESNETYLASIRTEIEAGRMTFADAARRFSQGASAEAGGLLPPVRRGDLAGPLDAAIVSLGPGEMSGVVRLSEGVALVHLEARHDEGYAEFTEALPEALEAARRRGVQFAYERRLRDVSPWVVLGDARVIDQLDWAGTIVRGDGMTLSKGDFVAMFPSVVSHDVLFTELDTANLLAKSLGAALFVRSQARAAGLASHAYVERATQIAERIVRADRRLRERVAEAMAPSPEEAVIHHATNSALFTPARRWNPLVFTVKYPERASRIRGREMAREILEDFVRRARGRLLVEASTQARQRVGNRSPEQPLLSVTPDPKPAFYTLSAAARQSVITNLVADYDFPDVFLRVGNPGYVFLTDLPAHAPLIRPLKVGEFSPIEFHEEEAVVVFLLDYEDVAREEFEQLRVYVAQELALKHKTQAISDLLDTMEGPGGLEFLY